MKISGFTIIRNGVHLDYPFVEAITSVLPVCDEFIVSIGQCIDQTEALIRNIGSPKIKIVHHDWNLENRTGGTELAIQTNYAKSLISGDWGFYIQADEVFPEGYENVVKEACKRYLGDKRVEGLVFDYLHFYGNYEYVGKGRDWYRREIRIIRNVPEIQSHGDAQGFRVGGRKLNCKLINAPIYHYGFVRRPDGFNNKRLEVSKFWHTDEEIQKQLGGNSQFIYENNKYLGKFQGTHPVLMQKRISEVDWKFIYDPKHLKRKLKYVVLDAYEDWTGKRLFEFKNYKLI